MNNIKLSIIIPIYNVEKYLNRCLDSIVRQIQDYSIEIILVNDGSTDNSLNICNEYKEKFPYIKVLNKKNGGLSDARNYGVYQANGEYIYFFDSDDMLCNKFLETIYPKLFYQYDIILFDGRCIDEDDNFIDSKYKFEHGCLKSNTEYNIDTLCDAYENSKNILTTVVWLGVYRKDLLLDNALFFEKLLHEDELWTIKTFINANSIWYINKSLYYYRIRENSIMRNNVNDNSHIKALYYIYESLPIYFNINIKNKNTLKFLKDEFSKRYLHSIYTWEFNKDVETLRKINSREILKNSKSALNVIRAIILIFNKRIYCNIFKKGEKNAKK